jgi:Cof subfamily protein (haloacid dehalogenase superfamily)
LVTRCEPGPDEHLVTSSTAGAIIFVDYDGTLLTSRDALTDATRDALAHALAAGVRVVPASGRPLAGMHLHGCPLPGVAIALNGAVVRRHLDDMPWETEHMVADDVRKCVTIAHSLGQQVSLYTADAWLAEDPSHPRVLVERQRVGVRPAPMSERLPPRVHKVLVLGTASDLDTCEARLRGAGAGARVHWLRTNPCYLEIGRAGVSKRTGLDVVRGWLGAARTYAIGDGLSDVPMFDRVDVAIAMANAPAVVQSRAHVVVASNDEDGCADTIKRIVRGEL